MRRGRNIRYSRIGGASGGTPTPPGPQFYVNPSVLGTGSGLSAGNATTFANIWAIITPYLAQGPEINVLGTDPSTDGKYTGASSVIQPGVGIAGVAGKPIIIRAVNDGGVWISGSGVRTPCLLDGPTNGNNYFTVIGLNFSDAKDTGGTGQGTSVVYISGHHNTFQRCVGWDGVVNHNNHVWSIDGGTAFEPVFGCNNLVEDCAGFGSGRKMIENFDNNGPNVIRRFYGRWEDNICTGPKRTIQDSYHSANLTVDNFISRVREGLPASYLLQNDGVAASYPLNTSCTQGSPDDPLATNCTYPGLSAVNDSLINEATGWCGENEYNAIADGTHVDCNNVLSGFLILQLSGEPIAMLKGTRGMWEHKSFGNTTIKDSFVYVAPGVVDAYRGDTGSFRGYVLSASANDGAGHTAAQCFLTNATSIAPNAPSDSINAKWTVSNKITSTTLAGAGLSVAPAAESLYTGSLGAKLRYRYNNGVLSGVPLWPWPMAARIAAAQTLAGRVSENIDTVVQATFGTFP